jgi:hypothetical protein
MTLHFLKGNPQAPRGHAILMARIVNNPRLVFATYCIVPPIPTSPSSLTKLLPPIFTSQIPLEELPGATGTVGMPFPPVLEEWPRDQLERLADLRHDDLCDLGTISSTDDTMRLQMAITGSQEYAQFYENWLSSHSLTGPDIAAGIAITEPELETSSPLDTEELMIQTMPDRQKLAELGKLIGTARYALDGHDHTLLQETRRKMQRLARFLPDKYRGEELLRNATSPESRGAQLAELYLRRAYKLLDEEYADIPPIEQTIRELKEQP